MPTLDWIGKSAVVNHHQDVPYRLLNDNPALSAGSPDTGNLLVQGDNLQALKALLPYYAGQVKCIYIDPPYNTGNEGWIYNDNVNSPEIRRWLGQTVGKESEDLSRHDKWLCMMYPRLVLLREFLREDGSIFISIDDNEVATLRLIMDEIFGAKNFQAEIEWQKRYTRSNNTDSFTSVIDHTVVYQKNEAFKPNLFEREETANARYTNPDNDLRGPWKSIPFLNPLSCKERPNLCYDIINPNTQQVIKPSLKAWRSEENVFNRLVKQNKIWWGKDGKSKTPSVKRFLSEMERGMTPINFWDYQFAGHTDAANAEIKAIFGAKVFDTPKPTLLIKRILQLASDCDSLILDSFAGSGTTGDAVMQLNKEDGGNRRVILVEMEANIAQTVTAERLRRVICGYGDTPGLGGGFRYATLSEPLLDEGGQISKGVTFGDLARHIYFAEAQEPLLETIDEGNPLIGCANGLAYYLLWKGHGTETVLDNTVLRTLPSHDGPKVVYADGCRVSATRLKAAGVVFTQVPYEVKTN